MNFLLYFLRLEHPFPPGWGLPFISGAVRKCRVSPKSREHWDEAVTA